MRGRAKGTHHGFYLRKPGGAVPPGVCLYPQPGGRPRHCTVVQALTHAASLRSAEAVKPWVYRILVNESLAYLRRNKRFLFVETLPEQQAEDADIGERLDVYRAVERLDPKLRTVVMLRFYEDMKLEDIAHITGANLSTVKSRLYTALGRLREDLGCDIG